MVAGKGFCESESPDFGAAVQGQSEQRAASASISGKRSGPAVGTKKRIKVSIT